jgi:hypothetical protein
MVPGEVAALCCNFQALGYDVSVEVAPDWVGVGGGGGRRYRKHVTFRLQSTLVSSVWCWDT